jgi:hypothetical protein
MSAQPSSTAAIDRGFRFAMLFVAVLGVRLAAGEAYLGTVAGNGTSGFAGDGGFALDAALNSPMGVAIDAQDNAYIADTNNHRIRKLTAATGLITTIAGTGTASSTGDGGQATAATVNAPAALALAGGLLYIAERGGHRIRCIDLGTGVISTVAGSGVAGYLGDGGSATAARLNNPYGVAVGSTGDLFIADTTNHRIRKVSGGIITTVAGTGTAGLSGDGAAATAAQVNGPYGVTVTSAGDLLIADTGNSRVRQVTAGTITTIAGTTYGFSGDGGAATAAKLGSPRSVLELANGDLLISDYALSRVRRISVGIISTVYGTGTSAFTGDAGPASAATLNGPHQLGLSSTGAVFVMDINNRRVRVASTGPVVKNHPAVPADPVFATTTTATTLAASTAGEASVTYTWSTVGTPPAPVAWSVNGTNAAKDVTATFTRAGNYLLAVTMAQGTELPLTTGVAITVGQVPTTLTIAPTSATLALNATQAFTVGSTGTDQFGQAITTLLPTWTLTGAGTLSTTGSYTAPAAPGGPHTVQATVGPRAVSAPVTVVNTTPVLSSITGAATVTGTTVTLTANATDDGGLANLIYTWTQTGTPPAPVLFGYNGVNAAKSTTITFSQPGSYGFQVIVEDSLGLTATGTITVNVVSTLTSVTVAPAGTMINPGASRTFSAAPFNQFNQPHTPIATWTWTRSGGGTIVASTGVLTASTTPGGPYTVTASGGGKSGNTTFSVGTAVPIAHGQAVQTAKDTATPVTLNGSDANLDPLTYAIVSQPTQGSLSGTPPNVVYQPNAGVVGNDQFTFTVSDATSTSAPATIQISVLEQAVTIAFTRSPLAPGDYFDANRWSGDASYRTAYLAASVPGRVWQTATPGAGVPVISCASQRYSAVSSATVTLTVTATANVPVSFTCFGEGYFIPNAQNALTVAANAQGVAQVSFLAPEAGSTPVLVASPLCQGRLRLIVKVNEP